MRTIFVNNFIWIPYCTSNARYIFSGFEEKNNQFNLKNASNAKKLLKFIYFTKCKNGNPKLETNLRPNLNKIQINKNGWSGRIDWMLWNKMIKINKFLVISDLLAWHEANWILTPLKRNNLRHTQSPMLFCYLSYDFSYVILSLCYKLTEYLYCKMGFKRNGILNARRVYWIMGLLGKSILWKMVIIIVRGFL